MKLSEKTYIIAEAGVNHNGSVDMAKRLIDVAAEADADAVKFQTFRTESVISRNAPKAEYQCKSTDIDESQFDMVKKLELDASAHRLLIEHCRNRGIQFLSTPFDLESLELLDHTFDIPFLKIPSGEITNAMLLLHAAQTGKPVILSTGMSTLEDIEMALGILAFGYTAAQNRPSVDAFLQAFNSEAGRTVLQEKVILLHCTTEYPAPYEDVNLRAMDTIRSSFGLPVGLSDHTLGIEVAIAAVARGAVMIEKHFTLDRSLPGPDHKASLQPDELKTLVQAIRHVEQAMGSSHKKPASSELKNLSIARKSLVAARPIKAGERFTDQNVIIKRPGTGISPLRYWDLLGTIAVRDYQEDEVID